MNITFCINTTKTERAHLSLLLRSMSLNLSRLDYPIIVYIENDTPDNSTRNMLRFLFKETFKNLRIVENPLPIPLGYARNINLMFDMADTEIVSYLQSDMVVCKNYDLEILKHLSPDTIISSTRIEPPLHPPSPEKITRDFGLDPTTFDIETFTVFAETCKQNTITDYWFAPFTLYKKNWLDIGGQDTLFRRSREDSDLLYRFAMKNLQMKQAWNAIVYHFTCTSSRGPKWWDIKNQSRTKLQQVADRIELGRFLRKWSTFKHSTKFDPSTEYKYQASVNFSNVTPHNGYAILNEYYRFNKIYIDNQSVREHVKSEYNKFHNPANELLNISDDMWKLYHKYYRTWDADSIFVNSPILDDDVILNLDPQSMDVFTNPIILQLNDIIHQSEIGDYECGTGTLQVNRIQNRIQENVVVKNPPVEDVILHPW